MPAKFAVNFINNDSELCLEISNVRLQKADEYSDLSPHLAMNFSY